MFLSLSLLIASSIMSLSFQNIDFFLYISGKALLDLIKNSMLTTELMTIPDIKITNAIIAKRGLIVITHLPPADKMGDVDVVMKYPGTAPVGVLHKEGTKDNEPPLYPSPKTFPADTGP